MGAAAGVWLGVPENDPVLIVVGVIVGLLAVGRHRDAGVGWGLGLALAWTVVIGSVDTGWSFVGGLLCLSPLVAVALRPLVPAPRFSLAAWPWVVVGAWSVSLVAARWVAVAPDATWTRVVAVGAGAAALGLVVRR
ncbi:hypothetical protein [Actinospongicola halichondriae]|uniref:hypothetical protein n=1 Tax=Actinospongicola halichondriae TaxID=3236844 RepID=UPI003D5675B2